MAHTPKVTVTVPEPCDTCGKLRTEFVFMSDTGFNYCAACCERELRQQRRDARLDRFAAPRPRVTA